jgi:hypothetical protein
MPVWSVYIKQSLVEHDEGVSKGIDSCSKVVELFGNELIHVSKADTDSTSGAEADAKKVKDIDIDAT